MTTPATTTSPRIDTLMTVSNYGGGKTWKQLLDDVRRRTVHLDELGYDGIWLGEHHFIIESSDAVPNPLLLMADLGPRTQRIRFCTGGVTAPVWHPIRLAEDIAMVDHFTDGRLEVGFIRGLLPIEINNINPDADRANVEKNMAIFVENVQLVRRALSEHKFQWDGPQYKLPTPGIKYSGRDRAEYVDENGEMIHLSIFPRAYTQPTPPLWSLTDSMPGAINAAEMGLGVVTWFPTGNFLKDMMARHNALLSQTLGKPVPLGNHFAINRKTILAKTDAEARELYEPLVNKFYQSWGGNGPRSKQVWFDTGEDAEDPKFKEMSPYDILMERDHLLIGSPDTVIERMLRMGKTHNIRHWLTSFNIAGLSDEARDYSIDLFAREVMPALRGSLPIAAE